MTLDRARLAAIFPDREEQREILHEAYGDITSTLDALDGAARIHNAGIVRELAHRIKGVAGNVGAMDVYDAAQSLEDASQREPDLIPALTSLRDAVTALSGELD